MKQIRRRRHLRPRPSRSQVRQQIENVRRHVQLFQLEWLVGAQQENPSMPRLQFLHDAIVSMRDELSDLERA